ncbi:MAG: hypothetical protein GC180_01255 [Bacteroidetes bacterium]|nr:hypothetical protein [Bacteroidota bacterium]
MSKILHILSGLLLPASLFAQSSIMTKKATLPVEVRESSGLEWVAGGLWSFNDSGNPPFLFQLDSNDGTIIKKVTIGNYGNTDWEDIASDSDYLYVGDFGNNDGNRKDLKVLRIPVASLMSLSDTTVDAEAIEFSYSDQTDFNPAGGTNFDCESMLAMGNSLYLFTKDRGDYHTRVYPLSKIPGTYSISSVATFNSACLITAADINPSQNTIALLAYSSGKTGSRIFLLSNFSGNAIFSGKIQDILLTPNANGWQTEGLLFLSDERIFVSCEATSSYPSGLYSIDLPYLKSDPLSVGKLSNADTIHLYPVPSTGWVYISGMDEITSDSTLVMDPSGKQFTVPIRKEGRGSIAMDLSELPSGTYFLRLTSLPRRTYKIVRE